MTSYNEKNSDTEKSEAINQATIKENLKNEAWHMEELYWEYVEKNDIVNYKNLWHDDLLDIQASVTELLTKAK